MASQETSLLFCVRIASHSSTMTTQFVLARPMWLLRAIVHALTRSPIMNCHTQHHAIMMIVLRSLNCHTQHNAIMMIVFRSLNCHTEHVFRSLNCHTEHHAVMIVFRSLNCHT